MCATMRVNNGRSLPREIPARKLIVGWPHNNNYRTNNLQAGRSGLGVRVPQSGGGSGRRQSPWRRAATVGSRPVPSYHGAEGAPVHWPTMVALRQPIRSLYSCATACARPLAKHGRTPTANQKPLFLRDCVRPSIGQTWSHSDRSDHFTRVGTLHETKYAQLFPWPCRPS